MGWTVAVAGVRDESETATEALRAVRGLQRQGKREGWSFAAGRRLEAWRCEEVAVELARRTGQPAFAAWVDDSDCAYIGTADAGGGHTTWLPIAEAVSSYEVEDEHFDPEIAEIRRHNQRWLSLQEREQAALELASWSEHSAPTSTTGTAIVNTWRDDPEYPGEGPVFIEDSVREILELMGLPRVDIIDGVICAADDSEAVFEIVRVDLSVRRREPAPDDAQISVSVTEIVGSEEQAAAEVERLKLANADDDIAYFFRRR